MACYPKGGNENPRERLGDGRERDKSKEGMEGEADLRMRRFVNAHTFRYAHRHIIPLPMHIAVSTTPFSCLDPHPEQ